MKSRSFLLFFKHTLQFSTISGENFVNSFNIELALHTNIPLFQEYFPSLKSTLAFLALGFSINSATLVAFKLFLFKLFSDLMYPYPVAGNEGTIPKIIKLPSNANSILFCIDFLNFSISSM